MAANPPDDPIAGLPAALADRLADVLYRAVDAAARAAALRQLVDAHPEHAAALRAAAAAAAARGASAPDGAAVDAPPTPVGEAIGPFCVLGLLGRGGYGEVFLAEQSTPVRRRVALKVLKRGMDSGAILRRFAREQQVLARMNHDGIARFLDAGMSPGGQPYFAMELVEGRPIVAHCAEHGLGLRARLDLFVGVCSNYLCDLASGDPVLVSGPAGKRFLLPVDRSAHDYLFVATGTGIAPFRGMLHELLVGPPAGSPWRDSWQGPCQSRIHLVMGSPYTSDLLYDGWLRELAQRHPSFSYHPVVSREALARPGWGPHAHQYVAARMDLFAPLLSSDRTLVYLCGLAGMQIGLFKAMASAGVAGGYLNVHEEISAADPSQWTDEQVKRRIRPTHRCMMEVY